MRNLSDECKTCKDNHFDMAMCIDICGIPMDILDEIERKRIKEEEKTMTLRVYDSDGTVHDYMNVHQIIDVDGSVLIIYTEVKDDKLKCVGHDKINVDRMEVKI